MPRIRRLAIVLVVLACAAEILVRSIGILDFPIYQVDFDIGYLLQPNQSGAFLNKNGSSGLSVGKSWSFLDQNLGSMQVRTFNRRYSSSRSP